MKTKIMLLLAVIAGLSASPLIRAEAATSLADAPWPDCGIYTLDNVVASNYGGNLTVVSVLLPPSDFQAYDLTSYNGWEILEVYFWVSSGPNLYYIYPPGTEEVLIELPGTIVSTSVSLEKPCPAQPACVPTGRYVYTLFGNYACNLISEDKDIPSRFLDPEYTAPLCQLPVLAHRWNGDWVKNQELDCGDYFKAGNHYDTSLLELP